MIVDYSDASAATDIDTDVCIVGAGPAGLSIAYALADTNVDVCILESGTWTGRQVTQNLCAGASIGDIDLDPAYTRLRAFGGSCRLWGGGCMPLTPSDFESRDWVPRSGWPIGYDSLAPYYEQARDFFGMESIAMVRGGFDGRQARVPLVFDDPAVESRFSFRSDIDFGRDHRERLEWADNVLLVLNATARECLAFESGAAVAGVRIQAPDGRRNNVRARHVVLACGGIENARLLLLSDRVTPRGLGNDHDQVGRHFMDHPSCRLGRLVGGNTVLLTRPSDRYLWMRLLPLFPQICLSSDAQRGLRVLNARVRPTAVEEEPPPGIAALRALRASHRAPVTDESALLEQRICEALGNLPDSVQRRSRVASDDTWRLAVRTVLGSADLLHALARKIADRSVVPTAHVDLIGFFEQAPNAESRISLGDDRDALGQRRVCVDWRLTELDRYTHRWAGRLFGDALARATGARFEPAAWIAEGAEERPRVRGTAHHMGTTRMSDDPRHGVVDRNCRVHGVDNLYVAGSSVFPTGGWAFPTFTIGAMGLRLADHLRARLAAESH